MRRLNLEPYMVDVLGSAGQVIRQDPYDVKTSLRLLLLHPQLQLGAAEVLFNSDLADKLRAGGLDVLLEEAEYDAICRAIDKVRGYSANEVPMIRRVRATAKVEVQEAEKVVDLPPKGV